MPWWACALLPVYRLLRALHQGLYAAGLRRAQRLPVPVIVVGNLTAGGSGKTPLVLALAGLLRGAGFRPGVVSRGYGGHRRGTALVGEGDTAHDVGDEPLLLHRLGGIPVAVGAHRAEAARLLLAQGVDLVLADDGLQHLGLARDIEICVVDGRRRFGNGRLLPAGPLRDPLQRLASVDFVVCNGGDALPGEIPMRLVAQRPVPVRDSDAGELLPVAGAEVHAVAGIGDPSRFFASLREAGYRVHEHAFPDHYAYTIGDFTFDDGRRPLLMTEKDAIKCGAFARAHWWAWPVRAQLPPEFARSLIERLRQARR